MTHARFLFVIFCLSFSYSHAQKNAQASLWRDSTIVIDGHPEDWDLPFRFYDSKSKLQYSVVNDAENLYICIMTSDPKAQMKILRAGMKVWLDTTGKKKESAAIYFPLKGENKLDVGPDPTEPERNIVERPDVKKLKLNFQTTSQEIKTMGLKGVPALMSAEDSARAGFKVAINWDKNDVLAYEVKIPFKLFYKNSLSPRDTLNPIGIGVKIEGMLMPMMPNASNAGADVSGAPTGGTPAASHGVNNNGRPSGSAPPTSMNLPPNVAELAESLQIYMRTKLVMR